jgi:hypothetical protein
VNSKVSKKNGAVDFKFEFAAAVETNWRSRSFGVEVQQKSRLSRQRGMKSKKDKTPKVYPPPENLPARFS